MDAGLVIAAVSLMAVGALMVWSQRQAARAAARQQALEAELAKVKAASKALEKKSAQASKRVSELETALEEAIARSDRKAMASVLWDLELERSYRQWRDVIVPTIDVRAQSEVNAGQQLAFAISQEVERLREEVGVAIRFDGGLDLPLEPEVALGVLRIAEELLALAAKESDEVVVSLDQEDEPSIVVSVDCQGWSGGDRLGEGPLEADLSDMAGRLDGGIEWRRDGEDHVVAVLRLPAPAPVS